MLRGSEPIRDIKTTLLLYTTLEIPVAIAAGEAFVTQVGDVRNMETQIGSDVC